MKSGCWSTRSTGTATASQLSCPPCPSGDPAISEEMKGHFLASDGSLKEHYELTRRYHEHEWDEAQSLVFQHPHFQVYRQKGLRPQPHTACLSSAVLYGTDSQQTLVVTLLSGSEDVAGARTQKALEACLFQCRSQSCRGTLFVDTSPCPQPSRFPTIASFFFAANLHVLTFDRPNFAHAEASLL